MGASLQWCVDNPGVIAAGAALLAAVTALVGITLTIRQARSDRRYKELLLKPHLELTTEYGYEDKMLGKRLVEIALLNTGLGPARVDEFTLRRDEADYSSFREWFDHTELIPQGHPLYEQSRNLGIFEISLFRPGKIIPSGERVPLVRYSHDEINPNEISDELLKQMLAGFFYYMKQTRLRFTYTSLLGGVREQRTIGPDDWGISMEVSLETLQVRATMK